MAMHTMAVLAWPLVLCGICPPSAITYHFKRFFDISNVILRLSLTIMYAYSELLSPSKIGLNSKTILVYLVLMRGALIAHFLAVLIGMSSFGRSMSDVSNLKIKSLLPLLTATLYSINMIFYVFLWNTTIKVPLLFFYFSLTGCVFVISFQTLLFSVYFHQVLLILCANK